MTLGQYAPRESVIHGYDPRTKLFSSLILMTMLMFTRRWEVMIVFSLLIIFMYGFAKLSLRLALSNIRPFIWLFFLTVLLHAFFTPGDSLFRIPFISTTVTAEGLRQGAFYAFRIILFILVASLLTLTTSPMSLTDAMERFLKPLRRFGVPAHEAAMMLSIALRFIPILVDEADRIRKAQESRGSQFSGGLIQRIRSVIPLVIPLFMSAFRRAGDLAFAMEARCWRGGDHRTSYELLHLGARDWTAMGASLLTAVPVLMWR